MLEWQEQYFTSGLPNEKIKSISPSYGHNLLFIVRTRVFYKKNSYDTTSGTPMTYSDPLVTREWLIDFTSGLDSSKTLSSI